MFFFGRELRACFARRPRGCSSILGRERSPWETSGTLGASLAVGRWAGGSPKLSAGGEMSPVPACSRPPTAADTPPVPFLLLLPRRRDAPGKAERRGESKTHVHSRGGEEEDEDAERPGGSETHGRGGETPFALPQGLQRSPVRSHFGAKCTDAAPRRTVGAGLTGSEAPWDRSPAEMPAPGAGSRIAALPNAVSSERGFEISIRI